MLAMPFERQAEEFAYHFLVDEDEVTRQGFTESLEIAEHIGVPEEMVRTHWRLM